MRNEPKKGAIIKLKRWFCWSWNISLFYCTVEEKACEKSWRWYAFGFLSVWMSVILSPPLHSSVCLNGFYLFIFFVFLHARMKRPVPMCVVNVELGLIIIWCVEWCVRCASYEQRTQRGWLEISLHHEIIIYHCMLCHIWLLNVQLRVMLCPRTPIIHTTIPWSYSQHVIFSISRRFAHHNNK